MSIRTLIVDDEPLACEWLRELLQAEPNVQIVGTCHDGAEALAVVKRDSPDLIFLDVRMPRMDGFQFVRALSPQALPLVVVVTAHDKYAVQAFEAHAVDFLLKPFDRERLRQTLRRAERRIRSLNPSHTQPAPPLRSRMGAGISADRIPIKEKGRVVFLKFSEIDWIGASDNYTELHVGRSSYRHLSTLTALLARLPPEQFIRISRSTIVNMSRVKEIVFHRNGDGTLLLFDGTLALSRTHRAKLTQYLDQK